MKVCIKCPSQAKYFFRALKSRDYVTYLMENKEPWLAFSAVDFLRSINLMDSRVFEYGSGASTLFWLSRGCSVVSIENDSEWFTVLYKKIGDNPKLDYRLVLPSLNQGVTDIDPSDPKQYASGSSLLSGYTFFDYVSQIDKFPDASFDVILIDGRSRSSCLSHSLDKIKVGGYIVLDNSDRQYYTKQMQPFLPGF